eukprot:5449660-Alexandrium_andersonii.AAC.1
MARQARPDIDAHVVVESAADIEDPHATAMRQMLGIDPAQWVVVASEGAFERRRSFLSTLPPAVTGRVPRRLDIVEPGWHRKGLGQLPTVMTARGRIAGRPTFSAYQYHPKWPLYDNERWRGVHVEEVRGRIAEAMQADPRAKA